MKTTMNSKVLGLCVAVVLAGCAQVPGARSSAGNDVYVPPGTAPRVDVQFGNIVVSPEPLVADPATRGKEATTITWRLPKDSPYRFPPTKTGQSGKDARPGIQFDESAAREIECTGPSEDGLSFSCTNRYTKKGKYAYTIRLQSADGKLIESDPSILNP